MTLDAAIPPWIAALPRHRLFDGPSPLGPLPRFSAAVGGGVEVWVKREDLLPLAFGGNKLRNLEFLVGAALAEGADTLITTGRRWSNHARLTAAAGAQAGLEVHLVLSGPATDPPNPGVVLDGLLGAVIHQTATDDRTEREAMVEAVVADLRGAGHRPYVIGVGGSGAVGAAGQVLAAIEALAQADAAGVALDRIVLPTATGGTQAGLVVGTALAGSDAAVTGITVAKPGSATLPLPGVSAALFGEDGQEVSEGSGVLVLTQPWPSMLRTLYADPDRFVSTYFDRFGPGVYFVGDGARRDEDGYFWITGRIDDVINVSGHRLSTAEIESALVAHPAVAEAAVIAASDELTGQSVVAYVTLCADVSAEPALEDALRQHVAEHIGKLARPKRIIWAEDVPKTRSGKIMRRLLRDIAEGRNPGDATTLRDASVLAKLQQATGQDDKEFTGTPETRSTR